MVATGMYYETETTNLWADIIMSFMISLIATTPGFILRYVKIILRSESECYSSNLSVSMKQEII